MASSQQGPKSDDYDAFAISYESKTKRGVYNQYYERPAMKAVIADFLPGTVDVLDLGCGSGFLTEWIATGKKKVTGVDGSAGMVSLAHSRLQELPYNPEGSTSVDPGLPWQFHVHDLNQPLLFLGDASYDLIVSSLTFHYVRNWDALFKECRRLLRSTSSVTAGRLIFSTHHPAADVKWAENGRYFETQLISDDWGNGITVQFYRRPLGDMVAALAANSFVIERVIEPRPVDEAQAVDPAVYEKLSTDPQFIIFVARGI